VIPAKLTEQLEDLEFFSDRAERIAALIEIGESFANPTNESLPRTPDRRVPGCESEVFVDATPMADGTLKFRFAVDNPQGISAMALARILDDGLSGQPLDQVREVPEDIVYRIFGRELSMGKSLGLTGMVRMARVFAEKAA